MKNNELPKEDLNLIAQIDARLKKLEQFMADVIGTPIAPVDTKEEVEYVRCVKSVLVFTEGHIYKLSSVSANNIEPFVMYNGRQHCGYDQYRMFFFPATEAEYLSQQGEQPNQIKEEAKERYFISVEPFQHSINDNRITIYYNDGKPPVQKANELIDKIKALLETI